MVKNYQKHLIAFYFLICFVFASFYSFGQSRNAVNLTSSILNDYKSKGYIDFYDDNPYLSGTGLPSNDVNGKIQVITELFEVDASTSNLWTQWVNGVKNNNNTLKRSDLEAFLNLSEGSPKLYSTDYSNYYNKTVQAVNKMQLSGGIFQYPQTDANGNWEVRFGYTNLRAPFSNQGNQRKYIPAYGEYWPTGEASNDLLYKVDPNLPHTTVAAGHVLKPGRYWLIIDYDYIFPVIIRPQAPHVEGIQVPLRVPVTKNPTSCGSSNFSQSTLLPDNSHEVFCFQTGNGLMPEYNYAGTSPDILYTKDTRLTIKGTVGGIFSSYTVTINQKAEKILAEDKLPDVVKIYAKVSSGSSSPTTFFTTPDANGKWSIELQGIEEVGTPYLVTVYGENKYGDLGEEIIFNVVRETPVVPFAVNQLKGLSYDGSGLSYFQGLLRNEYDVIFSGGTPFNLRGSGPFNSDINLKIIPISAQYKANLATTDKFQFELNSAQGAVLQSHLERNTTTDSKGNWTLTVNDAEQINKNIIVESGLPTYPSAGVGIISSQTLSSTKIMLKVDTYHPLDPSVEQFWGFDHSTFYGVDGSWQNGDLNLITYNAQGNELSRSVIPNMKLQKSGQYVLSMPSEYELPNVVNGTRVYRYEFYYENTTLNKRATFILKNTGLENFPTFNILQIQSNPLNSSYPINVITGVSKITGSAKPNEQLNLYLNGSNTPLNNTPINVGSDGIFEFNWPLTMESGGWRNKYTYSLEGIGGYTQKSNINIQVLFNVPKLPDVNVDNELPGSNLDYKYTYERQFNVRLSNGSKNGLVKIYHKHPNLYKYNDISLVDNEEWLTNGQNYYLDSDGNKNFILSNRAADKDVRIFKPGVFEYKTGGQGYFLEGENQFLISGNNYVYLPTNGGAERTIELSNYKVIGIKVLPHQNSKLTYDWPATGGETNNPNFSPLKDYFQQSNDIKMNVGIDPSKKVGEGDRKADLFFAKSGNAIKMTGKSHPGSQIKFIVYKYSGFNYYTDAPVGGFSTFTGILNNISAYVSEKGLSTSGIYDNWVNIFKNTLSGVVVDAIYSTTATNDGNWSIDINTITPNANQFYFQLIENVTPSIASSIFNTNSYTEAMMGSVIIDNNAPELPKVTNATNKFYRDITVIGKAEPLSTVKATLTYNNNVYNFDSFTGSNGVFKILIPKQISSSVNLPVGTYTLSLSASDRANNESSPYSYNFEIVPVLPLTIDYTEKSNINQTVFVNSSTLTATSGIVNLSSFTDLDFNNVKINLSKNLVKTKLFWSVSSGISIENFSSTVQYISKDNGTNLVSFNPSYIIKIDGTPIGYVTNAKIELINNAYEITSPLSNDFEIIPYFVLPASSNQANTNTPFFNINSNLNFTRIAIEKLLNKLTFNSSTYQYNSEILSDNIFSIIAEISGSVNTLIEAREINLLDVDEIVPNIDLVVSSISDTHREDRSPLASFDNSVFSDPDKADKFKIQLVRFETFQGQEPSLSNGNTAIPFTLNAGLSNITNLYKVLDLNSPVELQQGTNTFTTSYGDFKINISSTEWPFNNANITASFQPKNINEYDGAEIFIKFHLKFVRSGNSAPTSDPIYTYKWNIVGTTDIPKISYVNKLTNSNTIYRDDDFAIKSNNLSGISILQNASFDAVDYSKSFTKLKVQFNGFDPLLNEGFVVGNKILDVNSVVSKYTAKINNGILNLTGNTNKLLTLKIKDKNNNPIVTSNSNATGLFTINTALTQLSAYDKKMDFYLYKNNVIQTGIAIEIQIQVGTYIETFSAVSDTEGKVTIQLGTGQVTAGSISGIDWATSPVITTKVRGGGADNIWNYTYQTREASLFLELPYEEIDARNNITYSTLKCYFNQEIQQPLYKINASGYGFVVLSKNTPSGTTSDSEAVTELVFPSKISRSELESFLNNLQYDIKYAGQNVLTSGLRTIKFLQIQKEATDRFKNNQLRYFDLTDNFYINVEGNAEAYFENRGPKSLTIGGTTWNGTTPFNLFPSFRIDLNPLPSNLQNWNLKINPSVDIVSTDVYTFKDTQFTLDELSQSLKYNSQTIGTFIKNADFINFTFNQNATVAIVENMMKSFGYYSTNQDPAEYSCIINLSLNHPTDQNIFVEGVKIFFVFPENDAPKMSFVSQNKSYASGQKTTTGYTSVDLFKVAGQNGSLNDLDIELDPIESSQIISSIKFKINASNAWLNYTENNFSQPAEFFKIGGVEYRLITQSFTQNGFDFSFTLNGNELSVVITNPENKSKTDLLNLIKGIQYINKAPSTASPNPTRTITFFEVKDDGPQDDLSLINPPGNVNTTTYTGSNGLNKIVITLDPQAKVNVPPTLLKFAPLDNPTIQHEANRDVSNSLFTSLQVNGGFEEPTDYVESITFSITGIKDAGNEFLYLGTTALNLSTTRSGTVTYGSSSTTVAYNLVAVNASSATLTLTKRLLNYSSTNTSANNYVDLVGLIKYKHTSETPTVGIREVALTGISDGDLTTSGTDLIAGILNPPASVSTAVRINVVTPTALAASITWGDNYNLFLAEGATSASLSIALNGTFTPITPFTESSTSYDLYQILIPDRFEFVDISNASRFFLATSSNYPDLKSKVTGKDAYYLKIPAGQAITETITFKLKVKEDQVINTVNSATLAVKQLTGITTQNLSGSTITNYNFYNAQPNYVLKGLSVSATDNDTPTLTLSPSSTSVYEGESGKVVSASLNIFPVVSTGGPEVVKILVERVTAAGAPDTDATEISGFPASFYLSKLRSGADFVTSLSKNINFNSLLDNTADGNQTLYLKFTVEKTYGVNSIPATPPNPPISINIEDPSTYTLSSGSTTAFTGLTQTATIVVRDIDVPLILSEGNVVSKNIDEGATQNFKIYLNDTPKSITVTNNNPSLFDVTQTSLSFPGTGLANGINLAVKAIENSSFGNFTGTITLSDPTIFYAQPLTLTVTGVDNDAKVIIDPATFPSGLTWTGTTPVTFSVKLGSNPTDNVTVNLSVPAYVIPNPPGSGFPGESAMYPIKLGTTQNLSLQFTPANGTTAQNVTASMYLMGTNGNSLASKAGTFNDAIGALTSQAISISTSASTDAVYKALPATSYPYSIARGGGSSGGQSSGGGGTSSSGTTQFQNSWGCILQNGEDATNGTVFLRPSGGPPAGSGATYTVVYSLTGGTTQEYSVTDTRASGSTSPLQFTIPAAFLQGLTVANYPNGVKFEFKASLSGNSISFGSSSFSIDRTQAAGSNSDTGSSLCPITPTPSGTTPPSGSVNNLLMGAPHSWTTILTGGSDNILDNCEALVDGTLKFLVDLSSLTGITDVTQAYLKMSLGGSSVLFSASNSAAPFPGAPTSARLFSINVPSNLLQSLVTQPNPVALPTIFIKQGAQSSDASNLPRGSFSHALSVDNTQTCTSTPPASPIISTASTTTITGTAIAGSTVTIYAANGTTILGTATAGSNGSYTVTISPTQSVGATITATATVGANASAPTTGTITGSVTPTAPPTISTAITTSVTGTAIAGSTVTIYAANGTTILGTATAGSNGSYTVTISPTQSAGATITATATVGANASAPTTGTITGSVTPTAPPTISTASTTSVTGTAVAGSTVTIYAANGTTILGTATAGSNGSYTVTISPTQSAGATITATATVGANASAPTTGTISAPLQVLSFGAADQLTIDELATGIPFSTLQLSDATATISITGGSSSSLFAVGTDKLTVVNPKRLNKMLEQSALSLTLTLSKAGLTSVSKTFTISLREIEDGDGIPAVIEKLALSKGVGLDNLDGDDLPDRLQASIAHTPFGLKTLFDKASAYGSSQSNPAPTAGEMAVMWIGKKDAGNKPDPNAKLIGLNMRAKPTDLSKGFQFGSDVMVFSAGPEGATAIADVDPTRAGTQVRFFMEFGTPLEGNTYFKEKSNGTWVPFMASGNSDGAVLTINGDGKISAIQITITDNSEWDSNPTLGVISDPGATGTAVTELTAPNTNYNIASGSPIVFSGTGTSGDVLKIEFNSDRFYNGVVASDGTWSISENVAECLPSETVVSVLDDPNNSGQKLYVFDHPASQKTFYYLGKGTYTFKAVPAAYPIGFIVNALDAEVTSGTLAGSRTINSVTYSFYSGDVVLQVKRNFTSLSYESLSSGTLGGTNKFKFNDACTRLSDGTYTPSVRSTNVNTQATATVTPTYVIDRTAPTVVLTHSGSDLIVRDADTETITATFSEAMTSAPTITLTLSNGTNIAAAALNGSGTTWTYAWNVPAGSDGTATVTVAGSDLAGNAYAGSTNLVFTVDNTAPSAPVVTSANATTVTGTAAANSVVKVYASDGTTLLGTAIADGSGNYSVTLSSSQSNGATLKVNATDAAGNVSSFTTGTVVIDTTPPTVVLTHSGSDLIVRDADTETITATFSEAMTSAPTITLTLSNGTSITAVALSGSGTTWTYSWNVPAGSNGTATVMVAGSDLAGNAYAGSTNLVFTIDNSTPAAPVVAAQTTNDTTPTVSGTAEANATVTVTVNNATYTTTADGSGNWSITTAILPVGTFSVTATARDAAGNVSPVGTGSVTIDNIAPVIYQTGTTTAISSNPYTITTPENQLSVYDFDANESVNWTISGTNANLFTINQTTGAIVFNSATDYETNAGPFTLIVTATDLAGNTTSKNISINVTNVVEAGVTVTVVDGELLENPTPGSQYNGSFDIVLTHQPTSDVTIPLTSSDLTEGTVQTSVTFTPSNWNIPQRVIVYMVDDLIGDGAVSFTIATGTASTTSTDYATLQASNIADVVMTTQNNDPPGIIAEIVGSTNVTSEVGASVQIKFKLLSQPANGGSVTIPLSLSNTNEGILSASSITIDNANWSSTTNIITVTGKDDAVLDGDILYQLITGDPTSSLDPAYDALAASDIVDISLINQDNEVPDVTPPTVVLTHSGSDLIVRDADTETITATFSESMTATPTITIALSNGTSVIVAALSGSGTTWTYAWNVPAGSDGTATVTVAGSDLAGNAYGGTTNLVFTIDNTAPSDPVVTSANATTVTGTAEANSTVSVVINGVTYTTTADVAGNWSVNVTNPLTQGTYTVSATATDAAGNTSSVGTGNLVVDTTAPSAPVVSSQTTNDTTPTVSGTAEANSTVSVVINGVTYTTTANGSGAWSVNVPTALADGTYTVSATATDAAGNTSAVGTGNLVVDTIRPTVVLTHSGSDLIVRDADTETITANFSENMTVAPTITITLSNGTTITAAPLSGSGTTWTYPWNVPAGSDGTATVTVAGTDLAGNAYVGSDNLIFTIDNSTPAAPVVAAQTTNDTTPTVSGTSESGSTVVVTINGVTYTTTADVAGNWSVNVTNPLTQGTYTVSATATDAAGNTSSVGTGNLVVDTTAPSAPVVSSQTTNDTTPTVSGTAEANSTVSVVINGVTYTTTANGSGAWSVNVPTALADGTYTVSATATDAAGNTSAVGTGNLVVDTIRPTVVLTHSGSDLIVRDADTETITANFSENMTVAPTITITLSNGTTITAAPLSGSGTTWTYPWNVPAGSDGTATVTVAGTDLAGNAYVGSDNLIFTIDNSTPAAPVVAAQTTNDTTPTVSGTSESGSTVVVTINGVTYTTTADVAGNWSVNVTNPLTQGTYTVSATATDAAGNTSSVGTGNLVVDTTAPSAPVVSSQTTNDTTPTVSGTTEANSTVSVVINGVTYTTTANGSGAWSVNVPTALADGTYTVSATATDAAGNTSAVGTGNLVIDSIAPVIYQTGTNQAISTGSQSIQLEENKKKIYDYESNEPTIWSLGGTAASLMSIDSNGVLSFNAPADYEVNAGPFTVTVKATDSKGNTSTQEVVVTILNVIEAGVSVTLVDGELLENALPNSLYNGYFDIVLTHQPLANVILPLISSDTSEGTVQSSVTFTPSNWNTVQRIEVFMVDDLIGDGAQVFSIVTGGITSTDADYSSLLGTAIADVTMTTQNNDPPGIVVEILSVGNRTTEAGGILQVGFKLLSQPATNGASVTIPLSLSNTVEGVLSANSITIGYANWNSGSNTITVTGKDDAVLDGDISYQLVTGDPTSTDPDYNGLTASDVTDISLINEDDEVPDTTAPSAPVVSSQTTNDTTPTVNGTAEAGSTVAVTINGVTYTTTADATTGAWSVNVPTTLADGTYSVSATATDESGNTSPAGTGTLVLDATAPTVVLTHSGSDLIVRDADTETITANFSENMTVAPTITITLSNGTTITAAPLSGSGTTWTYDWNVPAGSDGTATVTVSGTDLLGNTYGGSDNLVFTIDNSTPAAPVVTSQVTSDTTPQVRGTAEAGSTVAVTINGVTYTTTADTNGNWSVTVPNGAELATGTYTVSATATDAAGNTSPVGTGTLVVDTTAPAAPVVTSQVTSDTTPQVRGTAEAGSTVAVTINGVTYTTTADTNGNWSVTVPNGAELATGTYTVSATATDAAGNTSPVGTGTLVVDTTAPAAPVVTSQVTSDTTPQVRGTAEAGSTVAVTINGVTYTTTADTNGNWSVTVPNGAELATGTYTVSATATDAAGNTSPVGTGTLVVDTTAPAAPVVTSQVTSDTTPQVRGTAEAGSTVAVTINGVTYTTTADTNGNWSVTVPNGAELATGTYTVSATATDAAGNTSPVGTGTLVVDTTAPAAPVVTSQVTSDTTPQVRGTAEAGSTVAVTINGVTYTTTADTNGNWSVTVPNGAELATGTYTVSATATDAAGNTSPVGTGTLVVDTTAPAAPVVTSQVTSDTTPQVRGTAEAGSTVAVTINGVTYTTTADTNGNWSVTVPNGAELATGTYTVSATATDAAGNTSPVGTGTLVVDTTAPAAPVVTSQVTSDTTPQVRGTAEAGSTVAVTINGVTYTTTADTNGNWSVTVPNGAELATGTYTVSATATDAAGNTSPVGTGTLVVDTTAPAAPVVTSQVTSDTTPQVRGTAEAGSTVAVTINGVTYTTTADTNGNWSVTVPNGAELATGTYTVSATATDAAGNTSPVGTGTLVVDTTAPAAPVVTSQVTSDTTPQVRGTAEAGSTVAVTINGVTYTTTADTNGNWSVTVPNGAQLATGTYTVSATATDAAGNTSPVGTGTLVVDTTAPAAPVVTSQVTSDTTPQVRGTAEAGSTVAVTINGVTYTTTADTNGNWSVTVPNGAELATGTYTVSATATDAAGNTSPVGTGTLVVDLKLDSDNDGVLDTKEMEDQTNPDDPCSLVVENQTEPLGIANWDTLDCDGDGVSNYNEVRKGTRDRTNGTVIFQQDTDGDGIPDYMDTDDDGDGVLTKNELPDADGDGVPDDAVDTDGDGIPDYLDIDDDGDGVQTHYELPDTNGDGIPDDAVDTDGDGIPDYLDIDDDGDGVLTRDELPDTNGDGVPDDAVDSDGDGIPDYKDIDDDGDGVLTRDELPDTNGDGVPDDAVDTDGDGISDYLDIDDDGDGVLTRDELPDTNGDGVPDDAVDTDGDGIPDYKDIDDDGDGVLTKDELPDTNGDGVPDDALDSDGDGIPDYKDNDDDGDGALTRDELPDANGDGVPVDALDTDGDGIPDYKDTDDDGDGVLTRDELPDANGDGVPDDAVDTDGDGIPNFRDLDNDGDGVPDVVEVAEGTDPSDGKDYKDSDGDEVPDYVESQEGSDLSDPSDYKDRDGDGVPDYMEEREGSVSTNPLDYLDSDGDGVPDYIQKRSLKLSVYEQVVLLWGDKDYLAAFPTQVEASTHNGVPLLLGVSWSNPKTVNVYKRGTYELRGVLSLPKGIFNPYGVTGILKVIVLPKPAPLDVTITNDIFEGSTDTFFIPVGAFVVNDPVDNIHVVSLLGEGYDNGYFEIIDNILFWNSADPAPGRTTFTVIIRVIDRDGNTLDKFFEIRRTRPSVSSLTIYNTFTPNGDRYNDNWGVPGIRFYRGARVLVFERGGTRVFYTENPDVRWDGTYKGKEMPVGSYYWVIEVPETGESRRGIVNLLRK